MVIRRLIGLMIGTFSVEAICYYIDELTGYTEY